MECNFYDNTLTKIGVVTDFVSMRWQEDYSDSGSFYIVMNKDPEALSLLRKGNFVGLRQYDTLMFIYSVEDKKGQLWAYGAEAKWLLKQRCYNGTIQCSNVESTLKTAVMASRPWSILDVAPSRGLAGTVKSQRSYTSLFDMSKAWCDMAGYGFRLIHDRANKKLLYDVYTGELKENAVFSEKYRNMQNLYRAISERDTANVATVLGSGEGAERYKVTVGETASTGFERKEIVVDARDLVYDPDNETEAEYLEKLEARGNEKLANLVPVDEITFDVDSFDFGTTFGLGDDVNVLMPEYNLAATVRVIGFTVTFENNVETLSLSLGTPVLRSTIAEPVSAGYSAGSGGGIQATQDALTGVVTLT